MLTWSPDVGHVWVSKDHFDTAQPSTSSLTMEDMKLLMGAKIAKDIRNRVFNELGYTCSAGIAHNKTLAKLCSALNKPNQQTIMRSAMVERFMENMPVRKIRFLGGKLGTQLATEFGAETAGDLWKFTVEELIAKFGQETGPYLHSLLRGISDEAVTPRKEIKSMLSAKSFHPLLNCIDEAIPWFDVLATELFERVQDGFEDAKRWPKTITVLTYYASGHPS